MSYISLFTFFNVVPGRLSYTRGVCELSIGARILRGFWSNPNTENSVSFVGDQIITYFVYIAFSQNYLCLENF